MVIQALLIAVIMFLTKFLDWGFFNIQIRPIWIGPLVGLALGDLRQGILMGAAIEAVFLGTFSVGGSVPSDVASAGVFGTAFGILLGKGTSAAVALSIPIGLLAVLLFNLIAGVFFNFVVDFEDRAVANHNDKLFTATHYFAIIFYPTVFAIMAFVIMMIGVEPVKQMMASMPPFVNGALTAMSAALPALGMAILVNSMWDNQLMAFFFIGFIMAAYLKLGTMPIAVLGGAAAVFFILTDYKKRQENKNRPSGPAAGTAGGTESHEMEDFLS
ncbi:hypothetical protein FC83_GL001971 [Agrilactobacillus composti DSM 18527 = JCM 14202]|uniref:PTS sugar transporter subunit IIC n=1 Tax=Agrilactobacillus composti DSM 18527 = JCM 14202 TaxID=1423734 RepID=X0QJA8_9LACO|nr:PTS sugar transporter subunit IIC [Agrilactobacillus composti]KRM34834.1 hypothetical protein FC83_GL001971 [Agrilactobacillus composti DSM 18527 = JCM 14202]GAF38690.1 hypothetical protein JCM14202_513 [Agrilactobacillus composti DSM 18527 = JCM 14202]